MIIPLCIQAHFVIYSIKSISFFGESSTGAEANNTIISIEGCGCTRLLSATSASIFCWFSSSGRSRSESSMVPVKWKIEIYDNQITLDKTQQYCPTVIVECPYLRVDLS